MSNKIMINCEDNMTQNGEDFQYNNLQNIGKHLNPNKKVEFQKNEQQQFGIILLDRGSKSDYKLVQYEEKSPLLALDNQSQIQLAIVSEETKYFQKIKQTQQNDYVQIDNINNKSVNELFHSDQTVIDMYRKLHKKEQSDYDNQSDDYKEQLLYTQQQNQKDQQELSDQQEQQDQQDQQEQQQQQELQELQELQEQLEQQEQQEQQNKQEQQQDQPEQQQVQQQQQQLEQLEQIVQLEQFEQLEQQEQQIQEIQNQIEQNNILIMNIQNEEGIIQIQVLQNKLQQIQSVLQYFQHRIINQTYLCIFLQINFTFLVIIEAKNNLRDSISNWYLLDILLLTINMYIDKFITEEYILKANNGDKIFPNEDWPISVEDIEKFILKSECLRITYLFKLIQKWSCIYNLIKILCNINEVSTGFESAIIIINIIRSVFIIRPFKIMDQFQIFKISIKQFMNKKKAKQLQYKMEYIFYLSNQYSFIIMQTQVLQIQLVLKIDNVCFIISYFLIFLFLFMLLRKTNNTFQNLDASKNVNQKDLRCCEILFYGFILIIFIIYYQHEQIQKFIPLIFNLSIIIGIIIAYNYFYFDKDMLSKCQQGFVICKLYEENICSICLEDFKLGQQYVKLKCFKDHIYHKSCLLIWFEVQIECPKCKNRNILN